MNYLNKAKYEKKEAFLIKGYPDCFIQNAKKIPCVYSSPNIHLDLQNYLFLQNAQHCVEKYREDTNYVLDLIISNGRYIKNKQVFPSLSYLPQPLER